MPDVILGNLPQASGLTGAERVPMDQRVGGTLAATALTPGLGYAIISLGSTNWTACGVPAGVTPVVGLVFTCSAVGTGTGTAQQVETVDAAASEIAALAPPTNLSYDPATRLLSSSTGADVTLPLVTTQAAGLVPTLAGGTGTFLRADGTWAAPPGGATDLSYDPATRLLSSSTGADVTLPLAGPTTAGLLPPTNDPITLASLTVTGTLTAPHIHGAMAGPLYIHVRNDSGVSLPAGSPVHVVDNQGDTDRMLVVLARADDPDTLPANGILLETLAPNADGHAINVGELTGFNTSGLTAGAQVFVGLTGGLTMTITGSAVQAIATVGRVHSSTGSILVNASPVLSTVAFTGAYGDLTGRPPEISQVDAEAGTATVFSLWTAQRWRQAAGTWWQTVTSAVGRSLVAAADAPAARTAIGAAGSGAITSSGLTMATARLLGRTTAGSGAVEEIQVSGGSLAGGVLTITGYDPASQFTNTRNSAANSPSLLITGTVFTGGTGTTTQPHLYYAAPGATAPTVFNTAGTFLGANMSSGFVGDLFWLGVNGTRQLSFNASNQRLEGGGTSSLRLAASGAEFSCAGSSIFIDGNITTLVSGIAASSYNVSFFTLRSTYGLGWSTGPGSIGPDLVLRRGGANTLSQINGTNSQTYWLFNTFTSDTNFERGKLEWLSNVFRIGTEKGSAGGTARPMELQTDGTTRLALDTVGSVRLTTGLTVATLPASPLVGMIARVTDASSPTLGATVSGGGSSFAIVCYNGASWTVMGI